MTTTIKKIRSVLSRWRVRMTAPVTSSVANSAKRMELPRAAGTNRASAAQLGGAGMIAGQIVGSPCAAQVSQMDTAVIAAAGAVQRHKGRGANRSSGAFVIDSE
jgi:hypothetical protein